MTDATRRSPHGEAGDIRFTELVVDGREVRIEHAWVGDAGAAAPLIVFLHEGLGSVAMWKDFPRTLCAAACARGLVFSREGYGRSTPRGPDERWPVEFMHRQAHAVLPALLAQLGIVEPPWLFGHSDGASIALLYAAEFPERVAGVIAVAPHIFVEDLSVASIARRAHGLRDDRSARAAGAVPRRPRLGVPGLERHLARPRLSRLDHRGPPGGHPLSAAGRAGRGRRVRNDGPGRGHRAAGAAGAGRATGRLRTFAAARPAGGAHRRRGGLPAAARRRADGRFRLTPPAGSRRTAAAPSQRARVAVWFGSRDPRVAPVHPALAAEPG